MGDGSEFTRKTPGNGMGIASMVLGIISMVLICMCGIGPILGILAVIFGAINLSSRPPKRVYAIVGLITGGIGILLAIMMFVVISGGVIMDSATMDISNILQLLEGF